MTNKEKWSWKYKYRYPQHLMDGVVYDCVWETPSGLLTLFTWKGKVVGGRDAFAFGNRDCVPLRAEGWQKWSYVGGVYTPSQFIKRIKNYSATLMPIRDGDSVSTLSNKVIIW